MGIYNKGISLYEFKDELMRWFRFLGMGEDVSCDALIVTYRTLCREVGDLSFYACGHGGCAERTWTISRGSDGCFECYNRQCVSVADMRGYVDLLDVRVRVNTKVDECEQYTVEFMEVR